MTQFTTANYNTLLDDTVRKIKQLSALKGGEYAGDDDRLANFRRNGLDMNVPMELVWRIYAAKHWDALGQYIKDMQTGKQRERLEGLDGRCDDLIVYLLLFKAMLVERNIASLRLEPNEPREPRRTLAPFAALRERKEPPPPFTPHPRDGLSGKTGAP